MARSGVRKRIVSSIFMICIVVAITGMFFLVPDDMHHYIPLIVTVLLVLRLSHEWSLLVPAINQPLRHAYWRPVIRFVPASVLIIYDILLNYRYHTYALYVVLFLLFFSFLYVLKCFVRRGRMLPSFDDDVLLALPKSLHQWDVAIFGIMYTLLAGIGLLNFWFMHFGSLVVLFILFCVVLSDSAAYFGGRKWGEKKMSPLISPGKTWAGFFSGLISVLFFGLLCALFLENFEIDFPFFFLYFVPATVILSVWGDLFISLLKRRSGLKDTADFIPGHGGLLDRLDSHMMVFAFISPLPLIILLY